MTPPLERPAESAGELYEPTGISPENIFQAIGRLRQEAQDEIERLLSFLDATGDPDIEDDETEDDPDAEPSLGAQEPGMYNVDQSRWEKSPRGDLEDEHDGREPSLCGLTAGIGNDGDIEGDDMDREGDENPDDEPLLGSFDRMINQEKSWQQRPAWVQEGEVDVLDAGIADGPRQATEGRADA